MTHPAVIAAQRDMVRETGALDRLFRQDGWYIAEGIELQETAAGLVLASATHGSERRPAGDVLMDFLTLPRAAPDDVLRFARRWGLLGLCGAHGMPSRHVVPYCGPVWADGPELVSRWKHYATQAEAMVLASAYLHKGEAVPRDIWSRIDALQDLASQGSQDISVEDLRAAIAVQLSVWMEWSGVRPELHWTDGAPDLRMAGATLFSYLARDLTFAVCRVDGMLVCHGCGRPFVPQRRPKPRQRAWCGRQECRKAMRRHATRDCRARRR